MGVPNQYHYLEWSSLNRIDLVTMNSKIQLQALVFCVLSFFCLASPPVIWCEDKTSKVLENASSSEINDDIDFWKERYLATEDGARQYLALTSLRDIGNADAEQVLIDLLRKTTSWDARQKIINQLGAIADSKTFSIILEIAKQKGRSYQTLNALCKSRSPEVYDFIVSDFEKDPPQAHELRFLILLGTNIESRRGNLEAYLIKTVDQPLSSKLYPGELRNKKWLKITAIEGLANLNSKTSIKKINKLRHSSDKELAEAAIKLLNPKPTPWPKVTNLSDDKEILADLLIYRPRPLQFPEVSREEVLRVMKLLRENKDSNEELKHELQEYNDDQEKYILVKQRTVIFEYRYRQDVFGNFDAALKLAKLGDERGVNFLRKAINSEFFNAREKAIVALKELALPESKQWLIDKSKDERECEKLRRLASN